MISTSSNGELIASSAASMARFSPEPFPIAIQADPAWSITAQTSAKSRLISPGNRINSAIDWIPCFRTSSAILNARSIVSCSSETASKRSFGMTIMVSTFSFRASIPSNAFFMRTAPSKANGLVTTPTVSAPNSCAISATTGAPPVPVPPPIPAATKTRSAP